MTTALWSLWVLLATTTLSNALNNTIDAPFDIDLVYVGEDTDHSGSSQNDLGPRDTHNPTEHILSPHPSPGEPSYFAVPIAVEGWGQPAPAIKVMIDTGSDDLWVCGSKCRGCVKDWTQTLFLDNIKDKPTEIGYNDGKKVTGVNTRTKVSLSPGGKHAEVPILVARTTTVKLHDNVMGMLGLRRKRKGGKTPAWYNLGPGDVKQFGLYLEGRSGGRLTLGGANPHCRATDLKIINVVAGSFTDTPMWRIPFAAYSVGDNSVALKTKVELDSGASVGWASPAIVRKLYKDVFGLECQERPHGGYTFCGNIPKTVLGDVNKGVTFTFGSGSTTVDIVIEPRSLLQPAGHDVFMGNIALKKSNSWLLGHPHMSNMYVLHTVDGSRSTVGLAQSRDCMSGPAVAP